jgi:OmpA-OmpF porin, OOP family
MNQSSRSNVAARRLVGVAVAAALAAMSGAVLAQQGPFVTSGKDGDVVRSAYGQCVFTGQASKDQMNSAACPPAQRVQTAATGQTARERQSARPAAATAVAGSTAASRAVPTGYVSQGQGSGVVTNPYGLCWRSGQWTADMAAEPCDTLPRAALAPAPVVVAAPAPVVVAAPAPAPEPAPVVKAEPAPAPAPIAVAPVEPPRPVLQKIALSTDVLFEFGKAELRESGKKKLDEVAGSLQGANVEEILAVGHADRIASEDFNQKLSEQRATAVKDYLVQRGITGDKVRIEGKGEAMPVSGDECKKLGAERASNKKLVACLQPDRRVEIEVFGTRQVAAGESQPGTGATSSPSGAKAGAGR